MKPAGGQSGLSPSSLTFPTPPLLSVPLQVKIFEEDFQRERSDRERMNEEKEELKKQVEKLQAQVTLSNAQVRAAGPRKGQPACPHRVGVWIRGSLVRLEVRTRTGSSSSATRFLRTSASPFPSLTSDSHPRSQSPPLSHRVELKGVNRDAQQ